MSRAGELVKQLRIRAKGDAAEMRTQLGGARIGHAENIRMTVTVSIWRSWSAIAGYSRFCCYSSGHGARHGRFYTFRQFETTPENEFRRKRQ